MKCIQSQLRNIRWNYENKRKSLKHLNQNCEYINIKNGNWWSYGFIVFIE